MKITKFLFLFSIYFLLSLSNIFAQNKDVVLLKKQDSVLLYNRIERLEGMKEVTEKSLTEKFNELKNANDKSLNSVYVVYNVLMALAGLGVLVFVIGYFVWIPRLIKKTIEERVSNIIEKERDKIIQIIKDVDNENIIKKDSNILVLSPNEQTNEVIKKMVVEKFNDLQKVKFLVLQNESDIQTLQNKNTDLVIVNDINDNNKFAENIINGLITQYQDYKTCFLYYGTQNKILFGKKNINFANSEFTLYSRIIETLKMQKILEK